MPRTILAVDVEKFGDHSRTDSQRLTVREGLYGVLQKAFRDVNVSWQDCYNEDRGDGAFILVPPDIPKIWFSDSLPLILADALRVHNQAHTAEERIRLRMVLHAGEIFFDKHGVVASAVNKAFRLLNSPALTQALAGSDDTLALITSSWFYDEVIRNSPGFDPGDFYPVLVDVKETRTVAWITTPSQRAADGPRRPAENWRIRLHGADGGIHGQGILIHGRYAITAALGAGCSPGPNSQDTPVRLPGQVSFDIPALPEAGLQRAELIWWNPVPRESEELPGPGVAGLSVAGPALHGLNDPVLRLEGELGSGIVRLRACSGHGYRNGKGPVERFVWARFPDHGTNDQDRVPLEQLTEASPPVTSDYHGSAVVDEQTGEILGIAMTDASSSPGNRAWMIPIKKIADEWPLLRRITSPRKHADLNDMRPCVFSRADILPLVDSSLLIPALTQAQSRHALASELPLEVTLAAPRSSVARADLTALVWCCAHVPGALLELANKIRESSRGSKKGADLADDLERFHMRLLPRS